MAEDTRERRQDRENRRNKLVVAGHDVADLMRAGLAGTLHFERILLRVALDRDVNESQEQLAAALLIASAADLRSKADVEVLMVTASTGVPFRDSMRPALQMLGEAELAAHLLAECAEADSPAGIDAIIARTVVRHGFLPGFDDSSTDLVRNASLEARVAHTFPAGRYTRALAELSGRGHAAGVDAISAAFQLELGVPPSACRFFRTMGRIPVYARVFRGEQRQRPNRFIGLVEDGGKTAETERVSGALGGLLENGCRYFHLFLRMLLDRMPSELEYRVFTGMVSACADSTDKTAASATVRLLSSQGQTFSETYQGYLSNFGFYHMGAVRESVDFLREAILHADNLDAFLEPFLARKRVPGFGHRFHRRDPWAQCVELCEAAGFTGPYTHLVTVMDAKRFEVPWMHLNIDGMVASILLTMEMDPAVVEAMVAMTRTPRMVKDFLTGSSQPGAHQGLKVRSGLL